MIIAFLSIFGIFPIFPFFGHIYPFLGYFLCFWVIILHFVRFCSSIWAFYKIFNLREILLFSVDNFVISRFSEDVKPWHLGSLHFVVYPLVCPSSNKAKLAIGLNHTSSSFTKSEV